MPASEDKAPSKIKLCHAPPATLAVCIRSTAESWAAAAKMARGPNARYVLLDKLPLRAFVTAGAKTQDHRARFYSHTDRAVRFSADGPGAWKRLTWIQSALPAPVAHVDPLAYFASRGRPPDGRAIWHASFTRIPPRRALCAYLPYSMSPSGAAAPSSPAIFVRIIARTSPPCPSAHISFTSAASLGMSPPGMTLGRAKMCRSTS
jgi:hypothetical protein